MNISREDTCELTATLKVDIQEDDYKVSVNKVLKDYQRKAKMPGFRPGKVPFGIINKMYGKAVIADEVNKILSDSINKYITDNKIDILGHPIANTKKTDKIDFEHQKEFSFYFDMGLAPHVDLTLSDKIKVDYYDIKTDQKTLDKFIEDIKKRNGDHTLPDTSEEDDVLEGKLQQLDNHGKVAQEGISKELSLKPADIKSKTERKKFLDMSKGDVIVFDPVKAAKSEADAADLLGITKKQIKENKVEFQYIIEEITRIIPANLDKELYKKVFPSEEIETAEQFKEHLKKDISKSFENESDNLFMRDAMDKLIEEANLSLPDGFLKTWLREHNENKLTEEQIEKDYDEYAKSLKWQLIQNKIIKDNNIKVEEQEIKDFIKNYFKSQAPMHQDTEESDKHLDGIVDAVMKNQNEIKKINDQLYDKKIRKKILSTLKKNKKSISYDDFIKLATKNK